MTQFDKPDELSEAEVRWKFTLLFLLASVVLVCGFSAAAAGPVNSAVSTEKDRVSVLWVGTTAQA